MTHFSAAPLQPTRGGSVSFNIHLAPTTQYFCPQASLHHRPIVSARSPAPPVVFRHGWVIHWVDTKVPAGTCWASRQGGVLLELKLMSALFPARSTYACKTRCDIIFMVKLCLWSTVPPEYNQTGWEDWSEINTQRRAALNVIFNKHSL